MRITASVAGILLIAAVAVAQDDSIVAPVAGPQDGSIAVAPVAKDGSIAAAPVAAVLDEAAIAQKITDLKRHVALTTVSDKVTQNKKTGAKTQVIKILTEQDQDDPFVGTMRFTAEMRDGTNMWYGQQQVVQEKLKQRSSSEAKAEEKAKAAKKKAKAKGKKTGAKAEKTGAKAEKTETAGGTEAEETKAAEPEIDYTGEDVWNFKVPMGKGEALVRPETRAYAAEYGFVVKNKAGNNQFIVVSSKYNNVESADEIMVRNQSNPNVLKPKMTGKALREGEGADEDGGGGGGE
jgi:hypothetical protein